MMLFGMDTLIMSIGLIKTFGPMYKEIIRKRMYEIRSSKTMED